MSREEVRPAQAWYRYVYTALRKALRCAPEECKTLTQKFLAHWLGYTLRHHVSNTLCRLAPEEFTAFKAALQRVAQGEPLQYVLGYTWFHGLAIGVDSRVLIPRRETEEMVDYLFHTLKAPPTRVWDACTGSGCIALALANHYRGAEVVGSDAVEGALARAAATGRSLGIKVNWVKSDMLKGVPEGEEWDLIVSNPPYVCHSESSSMEKRVLCYEPAKALFVSDEDPLLFYRALVKWGGKYLAEGGWLCMEINERFGGEVAELCIQGGLVEVICCKDLQGKPRWVAARRRGG